MSRRKDNDSVNDKLLLPPARQSTLFGNNQHLKQAHELYERSSMMIDIERSSTTTCCNLVFDHHNHSRRRVYVNMNYTKDEERGHRQQSAHLQLETTTSPPPPPPPPGTTGRLIINETTRHNRSIVLTTSKYSNLLFSNKNKTSKKRLFTLLVGLICVSSLINLAESIYDTQVNTCPQSECMCKWSSGKRSAQCERRNLRTLPTQVPSDIQVLDMNGNQLTQLQPHIFQERRLTNLQKLYLSDCKLAHIADEAFAQLTNLVELDLSHNNFQLVPTKPLELLKYSLRKLSLAHNQIHVIDSAAFSPLSHLQTLDLTRSMVSSLEQNAFSGLNELRELKLSDNLLSQLPLKSMTSLRGNIMIDLYGNPWHCDCELRQTIDWMEKHQIMPSINPTCASPLRHKDLRWQHIRPDDFMCPPVITTKSEEIVVGAGSNVTLACSARGSPNLIPIWYQDKMNLTFKEANSSAAQSNGPPISTELTEEKRFETWEELSEPDGKTSFLALINLKLADTSVFICTYQNDAGYSITNFSLIVDNSPPAHLSGYGSTVNGANGGLVNGGGGSNSGIHGVGNSLARVFGIEPNGSSNSQIVIAVIAIILLLAATAITLFVLKQVSRGRSSKSSSKSDLKVQQMNGGGKLTSSDKFNVANGKSGQNGRMFAAHYENGATDDEEDDHSSIDGGGDGDGDGSTSGSQSSCTKKSNTRVLAVEELDGFIDHLRSGIINMDYHSMSPVIQFNNQKVQQQQQQQQLIDRKAKYHQQQDQPHQLTHLNHFPSASNASSQQALYAVQPSNGSNSMTTTVSDLSPSSGSASTSFANANSMMATHSQQQQLHQQYVPANMATMLHQQQLQQQQQQHPITNCDHSIQHQQHIPFDGQQQELETNATTNSYTSDYQSGYGQDVIDQMMLAAQHQQHHIHHHHQIVHPPMYSDTDLAVAPGGYHYQHHPSMVSMNPSSRPSSMNGGHVDLTQNVPFQDVADNRFAPGVQQYQMRDSSPPQAGGARKSGLTSPLEPAKRKSTFPGARSRR